MTFYYVCVCYNLILKIDCLMFRKEHKMKEIKSSEVYECENIAVLMASFYFSNLTAGKDIDERYF